MTIESLAKLMALLEQSGELLRVTEPVEPALELAEFTLQLSRTAGGGPAILFENVSGYTVPVIANLLGSQRRICLACGLADWSQLADALTPAKSNANMVDWWQNPSAAAARGTQLIKTAPAQTIVQLGRDINLWTWPIPRYWPAEPRPSLPAAVTVLRDPQSGLTCVEGITWEVLDGQHIAPLVPPRSRLARLVSDCRARNESLPVAIVLGSDPLIPLFTSIAQPPGASVWDMVAVVRREPIEVVRCRTHDLCVPAQAEMIIEGRLKPELPLTEIGPLARSSGHYSDRSAAPVFLVTAVTYRPNPVWPAVVLSPRGYGEDLLLRQAARQIQRPLAERLGLPISDWHWPIEGQVQNLLFVATKKIDADAGRQLLFALWSQAWLGSPRWIVLVDHDVDLRSERAVWQAVASHVDPDRDVMTDDQPGFDDDLFSYDGHRSRRIAIDATAKIDSERRPRSTPPPIMSDPETLQRVLARIGQARAIPVSRSGT